MLDKFASQEKLLLMGYTTEEVDAILRAAKEAQRFIGVNQDEYVLALHKALQERPENQCNEIAKTREALAHV